MSTKKTSKEIDKAVRHLIDYIEQSDKWGPLFEELINHFCAPVASHLEADLNTVVPELFGGPYGNMAWGFLLEEMATTTWDNETFTPIDTYLKARGWRESPAARRYLRALNESSLQFLEITAVEPGKWVEVRRFGTEEPPIRVLERTGSNSLHPWDALVTRTYIDGKSLRFTGAMLPLNAEQASYLEEQLLSVPDDLAQMYQELLDEGEDLEGIPENFVDSIDDERETRLPETAFWCYAVSALDPAGGMMPEMVNTDDEKIVMTRVRFPIHADASILIDLLSAHPEIQQTSDQVMSWLSSGTSPVILGRIEIHDDSLVLQTNSVERGSRGVDLIESLLGDRVGPAMASHENLEDVLDQMPPYLTRHDDDAELQNNPEVQALLQSHLMAHYRRTLDKPIPVLDDLSPRACAADPERRQAVVDWLKNLENSMSKGTVPSIGLDWMWAELGLEAYKPVTDAE